MRFQILALTGLLSLAALGAGTAASQAQDSYVIRSYKDGQGLAIRVRPRSWLDAGNVARFLRLEAPSKMVLPVRLNVLFSGFSGEGAGA